MKIAIDIGHCSTGDRGAVSECGLAEHPFWAKYAPFMINALANAGHTVRVFRREDYGKSVARECKGINAWQADIVVSLHLNSSDNPEASGHEVIHYPNSKRGLKLAECINSALQSLSYTKNRGCKTPYKGRGLPFLSGCAAPAVIVEAAFLSNAEDVAYLRIRGSGIALAVAQGIIHYAQS